MGIKKRIILVFLLAVLMVPCFICVTDDSEAATSGSCGTNVSWNLSAGTLTLTGSGSMSNYQVSYWGPAPWYDNRASITRVVVGNGITSIGNWAFSECTNLSDVSLPESVTSIGSDSFLNCSSLGSIILPSKLTGIGENAFAGCSSLTSISIPASVTNIGRTALTNGNNSLAEITVDPSNPVFSSEDGVLFDKEKKILIAYPIGKTNLSYTVPSSVERIADWAFIYATFTSLVLSDNVSFIGFESIAYLNNLENLTLGKNLSFITQGAFGCNGLNTVVNRSSLTTEYLKNYILNKDIDFQGNVQTADVGCLSVQYNTDTHVYSVRGFVGSPTSVEIGSIEIESVEYNAVSVRDNAFEGCTTMSSLIIGNDVKYIGPSSFKGCTGLRNLTIPVSLNSVSSNTDPAFSGTTGIESVRFTPGSGYCYKYGTSSDSKYNDYYRYTPWFYSCDNLTSAIIDNGVRSVGDRFFTGCSQLSSISLSNTLESIGYGAFYQTGIETITLPNSLTKLGNYSFYGCTDLENVTLSNALEVIGENTFSDCSSLTSVTIPDSVILIGDGAFTGCTAIRTVTIGSGITEIGQWFYGLPVQEITISEGVLSISAYAFGNCSELVTVNLPDSLETIGAGAFSGCSSLVNMAIPENVTSIGGNCFENCTSLSDIVFGDLVTTIGSNSFKGCSSLESVTLGDGITAVGDWFTGLSKLKEVNLGNAVETVSQNAFKNCSSLLTMNLPNTVTTIGGYAFYGCSSLGGITIPNTVTTIGDYAFYGCSSMQTIVLSEILTTIEANVFVGCSGLTELTIPDSVTAIQCSFTTCTSLRTLTIGGGIETVNSAFKGIASLETLTLNEGIESIGYQAFMGCIAITAVNLPSTLTTIGGGAFSGCTNLVSISIPNGVTVIGDESFKSCTHLREITLPANLESINRGAFNGCVALGEINLPNSLTTIGNSAFYGCTSLQALVLPNGLVSIGSSILGGNQRIEDITIPNTVTSMNTAVFSEMTGLKNVRLGNGISTVDKWLCGITSLQSITLNEGITRIGYEAFRGCINLGSIVIPNGVTAIDTSSFAGCTSLATISLPGTLLTIGNNVFNGCESLSAVAIPDSVTSIGADAFKGCDSLQNLVIGSGITTVGNWFRGNTSLVSVTLNNGIQNLGDNAFQGCTGIGTLSIPTSIISISATALMGCSSLTSIDVSEENAVYSSINGVLFNKEQTRLFVVPGGFTGKYTIPYGVNSIENNAFNGVSGLTEVAIPDSVTVIASNAFVGCSSIVKVSIGSGIENVGNWFKNLISLEEVNLSSGQKTISEGAFRGCISLKTITIPDTVTAIGANAFYDCYGLLQIHLGKSVQSIGTYAFYNCVRLVEIVNDSSLTINKGGNNGNIGYAAVNIIDSSSASTITYSDDCAFFTYNDVKYLIEYLGSEVNPILPSGEQHYSIHKYAFYKDGTIQTLVIPSAVESLSASSFYECNSLRSVTIGENVETMGQATFVSCPALETIRILSSHVDCSGILSNCNSFREYIVEDGNTSIRSLNGVLFNVDMSKLLSYPVARGNISYSVPNTVQTIANGAFNNCIHLQTLSIPDSVTDMENYCIYNCDNLSVIYIGDGITKILSRAICSCDGLETLEIGASLNGYESSLFNEGNMPHLREIIISENNTHFTSVGGVLFSKDKSVLVRFPADMTTGTYTIPGGTKAINSTAFSDSNITAVVIPNSVTEIGPNAFYSCNNLRSIYLGTSVVSIGTGAFNYCDSINFIENKSLLDLQAGSASYGHIAYHMGNFDNHLREHTTDAGLSVIYNDLSNICKVTGYSGSEISLILDNVTLDSKTLPIVEISPSAFRMNTDIKSVEIGPSVTRIGAFSFEKCTGLETVVLPVNLAVIEENAFDGCVSITSLTIPNGLESLGSYSFRGCTGLTDLTIPISLNVTKGTTPDYYRPPFSNCNNVQHVTFTPGTGYGIDMNYLVSQDTPWVISRGSLTEVTFEEGIIHIGSYTLYCCSKISTIILPSTLVTLDPTAFDGCYGLNSFDISSDNDHFCVVDGVLFSKDKSILISYPSNKPETTYEIPTTVTTIGGYAFNPTKLERLYLGDSVTTINANALSKGSLKEITFGNSLTTIDGHAFDRMELYDSDCESEIDIEKIAGKSFSVVNYRLVKMCTVTFESNGGTAIQSVKVVPGNTVPFTSEPTKEGKYFSGWYLDDQLSRRFELSTKLYGDISLFAKWTESDLEIKSGDNVVKTVNGNSVTISADDAELIRYRMEAGFTSTFDLKFQSGVTIGMDKDIFGIMSQSTITVSEVQVDDDASDSSLSGRPAFDINTSGVKEFGTKKVKLTFPYQLRENERAKNLVIYYVENNDIKEKLSCEYESGQVSFTTNHLSTYVIGYEGSSENNNGSMIFIIAGGAGVIGILAIAGIIFVIRRRGH